MKNILMNENNIGIIKLYEKKEISIMCGIIGFTGKLKAQDVLLTGLASLEYRGYDSAGIAYFKDTGKISLRKTVGKVKDLRAICDDDNNSTCGIGHTRWATHGGVTNANAHPHKVGQVALIHNGIIENYHDLATKYDLTDELISETDTEVAAALINKLYEGDPKEALRKAVAEIEGSFAFCVLFKDHPGEIYAVRNVSPMVATYCDDGAFIASDLTAFIAYNKRYFIVPEYHILTMTADGITLEDLDGHSVEPEYMEVNWDVTAAQKDGYPHFMIKEIHEQPKAVKDTLKSVIKDGKIDLSEVGIDKETAEKLNNIIIVACGSAYHVGVVGQYVIESASRIPVRVELASEFRYRDPIMNENDLVIVISQSGETADSLAALRLAKKMNIKTLGIVNVVGSSIAREADYVFYTLAGPEIAVATTKAYSAQLIAIYALAIQLGKYREIIDENRYTSLIEEMETLPEKMERVLSDKERIQWFASKYANAQDMYFIGRGIDYAVSLEGSLKMKEISYVHSEAYAAGEIKHGPISLIEDGTLVIGICTDKKLFEKTRSNMVEVKSRGAYLMGLTSYGNYSIEDTADFTVYIPQTDPYFTTSLAIIPLQLLGYYLSVAKGLNVDKPRNLAKSVTVE